MESPGDWQLRATASACTRINTHRQLAPRRSTWSTKVKAKTVSFALSAYQANWLEKAITEHRRVKKLPRKCTDSHGKSCVPVFPIRNAAAL